MAILFPPGCPPPLHEQKSRVRAAHTRRPGGRGGASVVRCRRRLNRLEDLHVEVREEALTSLIRSGWCSKTLATDHDRSQGQKGRTGLEAIARHCHAAITRGGNDCRHDAGAWLAAALGPRLPGRRGAQAPQAQAWLEEGGWDPGVPSCNGRPGHARRSPLPAPVVLSAQCRASGSVLPYRTANHSTPRLRVCSISASVSFAAVGTPCSGGSRPLTFPAICCFASCPTGCRPISWVTWTPRPYACSIARGFPRRPDSVP